MSSSAIQTEHSEVGGPQCKPAAGAVEIVRSEAAAAGDWDTFLNETPGGHHVQTSMWSQLKASLGWNAVRLIAKANGQILGGAQILMRRYRPLGRIGYVPKGPIFSTASEHTLRAFVQALRDEVRAERLRCLIVQPTDNPALTAALRRIGCHPIRLAAFEQATTLIDLRRSCDEILMRMTHKARNTVRQGLKRGIQVRRGSEADLDGFHELLSATANRQGFRDYPPSYFRKLWSCFSPGGHAQLFLAEHEGKPVAAMLAIAFGDTVLGKKSGWSGECGKLRPNEALEWAVIQWAKQAGYRYYDFEGIQLRAAEAALRGEAVPEYGIDSATLYKLKFGGEIRIFPEPLAYFPNRLLRWGHRALYPRVAGWPMIDRLADRIKVN